MQFVIYPGINGGISSLNIIREVSFYHENSSNFDRDSEAEKGFSTNLRRKQNMSLFLRNLRRALFWLF